MSIQKQVRRKTVSQLRTRKNKEPIVCLTAYHAHTASLVDEYVDVLLVGDSLGMVMHGFENTIPVSLELMINHAQAVVRGSSQSLVVVDMPFGSYEESPNIAFRNCAHVMKETGAGAIKIEGGKRMAETISFLTERGIPVMAHIGLTPQSVNVIGGYKTQGRNEDDWDKIIEDAKAVSGAGAFSVVIEAVVEPLAEKITENIKIPTIGIGASSKCDGQILVLEDMLGLSPNPPKFVKEFASIANAITNAAQAYSKAVKSRQFPSSDNTYQVNKVKK